MIIQNLLLPKVGVCTEEALYFQREENQSREILLNSEEQTIEFREYGLCSFATYFNSLSIEKWKKYTTIGTVSAVLRMKGKFEVSLENKEIINNVVYTKTLGRRIVESQETEEFVFPFNSYEYRGIYCFTLRALEDKSVFYGGRYEADVTGKLWDTNIAVNICTFKREPFVRRNMDILRQMIFDNPSHPLKDHLRIYISDNGQSLPVEEIASEHVRIVPNKNVGGAGGFARGMMEVMSHMDSFPATHVLMMDDDVIIETESLFRTYAMLRCRKPEYEDMFVGGAMLRLDNQAIQVESGASWNAGALISNKSGFDLTEIESVLHNEEEEYVEFNAWWYCCMPMHLVNDSNLPLPIFIRGDDLEFGLRNMKTLVLLNGICVWHEAFENKYSSFLQYYILRNLLYDNALHFPKYSLSQFLKRLYASVLREVAYYRYKNVELLFRGVNDFFKGVDFLKNTDGEALHKEIMSSGYKAVPVEQLSNVAYRMGAYWESMAEGDQESRLHRIFRLLTINGYLLPAKSVEGKNVRVVSMALCRPVNFYRQKVVLNYDPVSHKGFVTRKSMGKALGAACGLISMTFKSMFCFKSSMKKFREEYAQISDAEFWNKYLHQ